MPHLQGVNRGAIVLFPPTLDDYIASDNPVRFIDAFVDQLDLEELGFHRSVAATEGRPAYHPADLLKLYIYGYLNRIRSSRGLERETHRNVEVETGYTSILGACDRPDSAWLQRQNRTNYMEQKALKETIVQAGDLAAFRSFHQLSTKYVDDDKLLAWLHEHRSQSKHTPAALRIEGEQWLRQHPKK